jgi:mono/diheme cytochrome c family protein
VRKVLKWIGISLASLMGLLLVALVAMYYITETKLNKVYDIPVKAIPVPSDPASLERGKYLVTTFGFCTDCHGQNLAGMVFDDGPMIGRLGIKNLTRGQGGIGSEFTDIDWVRAIRHGIGQDGKTLIDMPSNYYYNLSDTDLGAMIAYLKSLPPIDNRIPDMKLGPLARMFILQDPTLLPATVIDHTRPRPPAPKPGATVEYGRYLASFSCIFCHGENLAGYPGEGAGQNLTPAGNLAHWSEADFIQTVRTGITPEGRKLDPEMMPTQIIGQASDEELKALWLYLKSLPAVETESQ